VGEAHPEEAIPVEELPEEAIPGLQLTLTATFHPRQ